MAPPRTWAELPADVLKCVADRLHAQTWYLAARGVCTAWRSALPPASVSLVVHTAPASSLPSRNGAFRLLTLPEGSRCIGASHGWLAVVYKKPACFYRNRDDETKEKRRDRAAECPWDAKSRAPLYSRNFKGEQILLKSSEYPGIRNPAGQKSRVALLNPVTGKQVFLPEHEKLDPGLVTKVAFAPNPRADDFTVVAAFGLDSLAYISTRDGGAWSFGEIAEDTVIADVVYRDGGDMVYCLTRRGDVQVLQVPRARPTKPALEPLVAELAGFRFKPADVFLPLHAWLSDLLTGTGAKNLALCDGEPYQVWRNSIGADIHVPLEGGGSFVVPKDEVIVLRYDPLHWPCWEVVTDLGGHSLFVGPANSAVAVRAAGVPGLKGDCVYWVGGWNGTAEVFDMQTRRSTPCFSPSTDGVVPVCWYSQGDVESSDDSDGEILPRPRKQRMICE